MNHEADPTVLRAVESPAMTPLAPALLALAVAAQAGAPAVQEAPPAGPTPAPPARSEPGPPGFSAAAPPLPFDPTPQTRRYQGRPSCGFSG